MSFILGDLSITDMENRLGVTFPEELKEQMLPKRQMDTTNLKEGYWHCYDIPFMLVCGGIETATEYNRLLKPLSSEMKGSFQIGVS